MTTTRITLAILAGLLSGCRAADQSTYTPSYPSSVDATGVQLSTASEGSSNFSHSPEAERPRTDCPSIQPVAFAEPTELLPAPEPSALPVPPGLQSQELTLEQLEQLALNGNPTVMQAEARVRALRGNWVQVGLPPNPTLGYVGEEIGDDGTPGKQGLFVSQQFILGHKLALNRSVASQETLRAEQEFAAQRQRVLTDVRTSYYEVLLAQRRQEVVEKQLDASRRAVGTSEQLSNAGEIPRAGLLQSELEMQTSEVVLRQANNRHAAAWRQLAAIVGQPELPPQDLVGNLDDLSNSMLEWESQLDRLLRESPEMATAMAQLQRARSAIDRARVEAVPDITVQAGVVYDYASGYTLSNVQVGVPLPLWNRNQGGIRQAQGELMAAQQNMQRVELNLEQRLAQRYREYADARVQVEAYSRDILPKAQETFDVVSQLFSVGEAGYLDLLTAQRTYFQTNLTYLDALGELWRTQREIEGLLLRDSLSAPEAP